MHGRGADELDLAPLLDALDPDQEHLGLLPRGPLSLPPGGQHWYVVQRVGYPDQATFLPTYAELTNWLDRTLAEHEVAPADTVLGGFSQGAVMAYALGLAAGRPSPAGILAFSGFLPRVEAFDLDLESRRSLPVSITHGSVDPIIGVDFGRDTRARLEAAGLAVRYREDPVGHTITPGALAQAKSVLEEAFGS